MSFRKLQTVLLSGCFALVALFAVTSTAQATACGKVKALESKVAELFKRYGTLDNKRGQKFKAQVKAKIVAAQQQLTKAKTACATCCGNAQSLKQQLQDLHKRYSTLDNKKGQKFKAQVKAKIADLQNKLNELNKRCGGC